MRSASPPTTAATRERPAPIRLAASSSNRTGLSPIGPAVWNRCAGATPNVAATASTTGLRAGNDNWSTIASESQAASHPPPPSASASRNAPAISATGSSAAKGSSVRSSTCPTPTMTGMRAASMPPRLAQSAGWTNPAAGASRFSSSVPNSAEGLMPHFASRYSTEVFSTPSP